MKVIKRILLAIIPLILGVIGMYVGFKDLISQHSVFPLTGLGEIGSGSFSLLAGLALLRGKRLEDVIQDYRL